MVGEDVGGAELARRFYEAEVLPVLRRELPGLRHAAGRLGSGSDVLGLDDDTSRDHDWGCRLTLLVPDEDGAVVGDVVARLERRLPAVFLGHPVRFATSWDPRVAHKVEVATVGWFVSSRLGVDAIGEMGALDWLTLPGQSVLEVVAGPVFADEATGLTAVRERLTWYPHDVWLYVLAAGWRRLEQELPFVGRTADRADDIGSRVVGARLCRDLVHLTFLLERRWPPYAKWVGAALADLSLGRLVRPHLEGALAAQTWRARETSLVAAARELHRHQRTAGLTTVDEAIEPFWGRPYMTVQDAVARSLLDQVVDPVVRQLPLGVGSIEQWVDNVDVLSRPAHRASVRRAYEAMLGDGEAVAARVGPP